MPAAGLPLGPPGSCGFIALHEGFHGIHTSQCLRPEISYFQCLPPNTPACPLLARRLPVACPLPASCWPASRGPAMMGNHVWIRCVKPCPEALARSTPHTTREERRESGKRERAERESEGTERGRGRSRSGTGWQARGRPVPPRERGSQSGLATASPPASRLKHLYQPPLSLT